MEINALRIAVTVVSLLLFVALVAHTWSRNRRQEHEAAAELPFFDGGDEGGPTRAQGEAR